MWEMWEGAKPIELDLLTYLFLLYLLILMGSAPPQEKKMSSGKF